MIPKNRDVTHPGIILMKEFMEPLGLNQRQVAEGTRLTFQKINAIINGRRGISISTALRFARFFGNSPEFWLQLQNSYDIAKFVEMKEKEMADIKKIKPLNKNIKEVNNDRQN